MKPHFTPKAPKAPKKPSRVSQKNQKMKDSQMYMLDHMDQTFKNAGISKLQKQMDSKRKPHPQAEAEEMEMMDEPAPKKKSEKKGAMDDEFDLMGGKPKEEAPPAEVANVETKAEDQQVEED